MKQEHRLDERVRDRFVVGDLVFGGALGAFLGFAMARESIQFGGYMTFGLILVSLAVGARAMWQFRNVLISGERPLAAREAIKVVFATGIAATLATSANLDWLALLTMMGAWFAYTILSVVIDPIRKKMEC